jgi:hypothetical protein
MGRMSDLDIERQELGDDKLAVPGTTLAIMLGCTCPNNCPLHVTEEEPCLTSN